MISRIVIYGLWHLGSVTAACLARAGFTTVGLDPDTDNIRQLNEGTPPLFEPGLAELIREGLTRGKLSFTANRSVVSEADIVWVTFDTPVDDEDRADVAFVKQQIVALFPFLKTGTIVLISSQMPVGSIAELERSFAAVARGRLVDFVSSPENLRLGGAIAAFENSSRIVVGIRNDRVKEKLTSVLSRFSSQLIWMSVESAEMVKHAVNGWLATSVTFTNEVASLCEQVGADASDIERALRTEPRIGPKAYVRAGAAFAGGTLARDVLFLEDLSGQKKLSNPLLKSLIPSNAFHRGWPLRKLQEALGNLKGKTIALLGLAYKPGTDAIRRSVAIELCRELSRHGARLQAFDPTVQSLPEDLEKSVFLASSAGGAMEGAEALLIATEWPEFRDLRVETILNSLKKPIVIDQNRFLHREIGDDPRVLYITIGKPL